MLIGVPPRFVEPAVYLRDVMPVDHIVTLKHLHSEEVEVGSHHIVLLPHTYHIRVGEVCIQYRIKISAVALIAPAFCILTYKIRAHIGLSCLNHDIIEVDIPRMSHVESFGRQVAPHRGFRILFLLLVADSLINSL